MSQAKIERKTKIRSHSHILNAKNQVTTRWTASTKEILQENEEEVDGGHLKYSEDSSLDEEV